MKRSTFTMRRLLALVLVLIMVGSLFAGCSKKTDDPTVPSEPNETIAGTAAPTDEPTEAPTEEPTEAPTEPAETVPPVLMGTVNADNLNVRTEPYSTADILKRLAINTRIEILEQKIVDGVNWGRIAEGWVNLNYVTIGVEFPEPGTNNGTGSVVNNNTNIGSGSVTTNNTTEGVVTTGLNIRKDSNANSDAVGSYSKGDKVTILERSNGWGRTNKGWINLDYVDFSGKTTASSGGSSSSSGTNSSTVSNGNVVPLGNGTVVKTTSLAIRSGPGANYTQVSYIRMGETHDYFQTSSNGWVRMKKGWVNADYLDLEYYVDDGAEVTVTVNELSVREKPDYDSTKLATLEKNDDVEILEVKGTWGKIEYADGKYGWIDLDKVKLPTPDSSTYSTGVATVTADALNVREKASASSDSLAVVEEGDKFDVIEVKGSWGKIEYKDGKYGWINLKYTKMKTTYTTGTGYITASKLNVREEPDEDSDKIGTLSNGDKVVILDTESNWGKILYDKDDNEYGWISLKYVRMTSTSTGSGSTTTPTTPAATKYSVTITRPDNGTVTTSASSYEKGASVTLTATPVSGYTLAGLHVVDANGNVIPVSDNKFTMPEANVTVTATFVSGSESKIYTVTCSPSANVTASPANPIAQGTKVSLTINVPDGKSLNTLTIKDAANNTVSYASDYSFTMPAANVTVTATFATSSATMYNITLPTDNTVAANYVKAAKDTTVTLTATPAAGYELSAITVKTAANEVIPVSGTGNSRTFTMPAAAVTVTAQYTAKQYTATVSTATGGSATVNPTACGVKTNVTVSLVADSDYGVTGLKVIGTGNKIWFTQSFSGTATGSYTFEMPADNVTIEPTFEKVTHTITSNVTNPDYGSIKVEPASAVTGTTVTVTATPANFHKLSTLTVTAGGTAVTVSGTGNTRTFTMPAADVTISATFGLIGEYKTVVKAKMRESASTDAKELMSFTTEETIFALEGSTDEWIKTTFGGKTGYIHKTGVTKVG